MCELLANLGEDRNAGFVFFDDVEQVRETGALDFVKVARAFAVEFPIVR